MSDEKKSIGVGFKSVRSKVLIAALCVAVGSGALGGVMTKAQISEAAPSQTKEVKVVQTKPLQYDSAKADVRDSKYDDRSEHGKHEDKMTEKEEAAADAEKHDKQEISEHNGKDLDGTEAQEQREDK